MKYFIQTLGCAMNYSDSERVASILEKIGYEKTGDPKETDLYLFNTCSIRQKGEDRVYGQMRKLTEWKKINPRLLVGITGCMVRKTSTRNDEKEDQDKLLRKLRMVDFVFMINDTQELAEILTRAEHKPFDHTTDNAQGRLDYLRIQPNYTSSFQAFVPIQIGCDKFCTYCIVPYARGREESRAMKEIYNECEQLVENGCKEITLVGQTVNSYGKSNLDKLKGTYNQHREPFVELLTRIDKLEEKGLKRLRFTSSHPRDFTDALIKAHTELKTLTPHIHLPVQAGDNTILRRMNRKYTVEHYKQIIEKIRKTVPGSSITTDIIVGFCGETGKQFENTYKLFEDLQFDMAYIARYSPRPGTVSVKAFKDDVPREEKAVRWHKLNNILIKCAHDYHQSMEGKTVEVLVENYDPSTGECKGKSRESKTVQFKGDPSLIGTIQNVRIIKGLQWFAKGELITMGRFHSGIEKQPQTVNAQASQAPYRR